MNQQDYGPVTQLMQDLIRKLPVLNARRTPHTILAAAEHAHDDAQAIFNKLDDLHDSLGDLITTIERLTLAIQNK